jgi:transposase
MANVLSEEKQKQIEALGRLGWSLRRIEEATGVRRETAGAYLRAAGVAVRAPCRWGRPKPANEAITDSESVAARGSPGRASTCKPFDEVISEALERGRNAMGIYQDLVSRHGFGGSYGSVMRYVRKLRESQPVEAHVVIETAPGQEAQVDYGDGPMVRDPQTGKYRRTRLFILTLGCSRKSVRMPYDDYDWEQWLKVWKQGSCKLNPTGSRPSTSSRCS